MIIKQPGFCVKDAVEKRISVRTYAKTPLSQELKEQLMRYASKLQNPLGPNIRVQMIEKEIKGEGEKLGTYGIIRGAGLYLGVTVADVEYAPEALGYEFEQLLLYATSLGLGSCWLGGTFNRSAFAAQLEIKENEIFSILSPIGYPAQKFRLSEQLMRRSLKADSRYPWHKLFFRDSFDRPLSENAAGKYAFPLQMLRLAPSAVNKQPWRVVLTNNAAHFFEQHSRGTQSAGMDMQRIDVGIAICHFHMAAMEAGLTGHFDRTQPDIVLPTDMTYIASWQED